MHGWLIQILRWYRELIAKKTENPTWGHTRIRGALRNVGHELAGEPASIPDRLDQR